jgi:hypothetical protein
VLLILADGCVMPVNTTFTDPASRFRLDGSVDHATYLLVRLPPGDPVRLWAAVSEDVLWLLRQGEEDALGLDAPRRPVWQRGRYLFTSPDPAVAGYFHNKPRVIGFSVPRRRLASALQAGLLNVHLFLADNGETLDPAARFGAPDIALEVVALDAPGIRWLLDFLD